ncbi:MAG: hypothetical protein VX874_18210 [Pseudomonadota bacterium]|nr:hypothetical protein [Pseudomonadota bacterium]
MTIQAHRLSADGAFMLRFQDDVVEDDLDWLTRFLMSADARADRIAIVDATLTRDVDLTLREFMGFIGRLRNALATRDDMLTVYVVTSQDAVRTFLKMFSHITARRELVKLSVFDSVGVALNAAGIPPRHFAAAVPTRAY